MIVVILCYFANLVFLYLALIYFNFSFIKFSVHLKKVFPSNMYILFNFSFIQTKF